MIWWQELLARVGVRTAYGRDVVLAAALCLLGYTRVIFGLVVRGGAPLTLDSLVVANVAATTDLGLLAFRRRAPRTTLIASVAVALGAAMLPTIYQGTGLSVVACTYTVATLLSRRAMVFIVTGCAASHLVGGVLISRSGGHVEDVLTFWQNDGGDIRNLVLATIASFGIPALLGSYIQTRRAYTGELADKVVRLEVEQDEQSRARSPRSVAGSPGSCKTWQRTTCPRWSSRPARQTAWWTEIRRGQRPPCAPSGRRAATR